MSDQAGEGQLQPEEEVLVLAEPVHMVVVDGVRYRSDQLPGSEPVAAAEEDLVVLQGVETGLERRVWLPLSGSRSGYGVHTGGSGRSGYPTIS